MLDIKYIRENIDAIRKNLIDRKASKKADIDKLLKLDSEKNSILKEIELLRAKRNEQAQEIKQSKIKPSENQIKKGKDLKLQITTLEESLSKVEKDWFEIMSWFPNISSPNMPDGKDDNDNIEVKAWSKKKGYFKKEELGLSTASGSYMPETNVFEEDFELKDHVYLGEKLGLIDLEQSAKISGSRFSYLKGDLVMMWYAIQNLLTKKLISEKFMPIMPPLMVKDRVLYGTSHFPSDQDQVYSLDTDKVEENQKLYLVGSSEPSLFGYFMDRVLKETDLPSKVFATTTCFRSEVGSWGKDVRGIKRVHQFDKLEMDLVCHPDKSYEMMEYLLSINEWLLQKLELPYHIINMCKGDAGYYATAQKYDFEAWLPSQKTFMELGSDTNALDFQARRLNIQFIDENRSRRYVHTVNDTGAATRTIIAIMDNYQRKDGTISIPKVLQDFMEKEIIGL